MSPGTLRAIRDGLAVAGLLFAAYLFAIVAPRAGTVGFDAFPYWSVDLEHPYARVAGEFGAFTYTPVAARAFAVASLLSWPAFWFAVRREWRSLAIAVGACAELLAGSFSLWAGSGGRAGWRLP